MPPIIALSLILSSDKDGKTEPEPLRSAPVAVLEFCFCKMDYRSDAAADGSRVKIEVLEKTDGGKTHQERGG
jgi:hypothetical protein